MAFLDKLMSAKKRLQKLKTQTRDQTRGSLNLEPLEMRAMMTTNAIVDGDWFDPNTWDNGVPDESVRAIIGHDVTVELDGTLHEAKELVIHGDLVVPEEDAGSGESDKSLTTRWIHINSGGEFIVGTETDRYDEGTFTLTLTGTDVTSDHVIETNMGGMSPGSMDVPDNDGFLMTAMEGRIQLFGEDKLSFTKLATTAAAGTNTIVVENVIERNYDKGAMNGDAFVTSAADDGELNWQEDDQIVIASSSYDYSDEEVRIITHVQNNGDGTTTLTLNSPLENRHYGEIEVYGETAAIGTSPASQSYEIDMRAEVALLSRNVKIQGLESQDTDVNFGDRENATIEDRVRSGELSPHEPVPPTQVANGVGGHIMFMPGSGDIHVDGVQLDRMGQASQKGRYPVHWHLNDSRPHDFLKNSSITNSNNRGVTIHGTSDLQIEGVVLHDIHGHGFFFEDAVETGNELVANIAFGIHTVGGNDKNFANPGGTDPFVVDTHDSVLETGSRFKSSAAFWITNPTNTFVGNISAGAGGTGFWYALPRTALGKSAMKPAYDDVIPIFAEFGQFDNNSSHSTPVGLNFDRGSDIEDGNLNNELRTNHTANEYSPRTDPGNPSSVTTNYVNDFTNYKSTDAAVYHRGKAESIRYDGLRIADSYNAAWAVSETEFDNSLYVGHSRGNADLDTQVGGPRLYDGSGLHTNAHFAGFADNDAFTFQVEGSSFGPTMYHGFRDVSFENDGTYGHLAHAVSDATTNPNQGHDLGKPAQWIKATMDIDGSLTGAAGGGIGYTIVPDIDFLVEDTDVQPTGWDAWLTRDIYARMRVENNNDGEALFPSEITGEPLIRFTARDGDSVDVMAGQNNGNRSWTQIAAKTDGDGFVEGTFEVEFMRNGLPQNGFVLNMKNQDGGRPGLDAGIQSKVDDARIVVKIVGAENYTPNQGTLAASENALRSTTSGVSYFRDGHGNLLLNTGIKDSQPLISLSAGAPLQTAFVSRTVDYSATIEAEEFDNGIDGIAYHDSDATNSLGSFRSDTGVDATLTVVGDITDGEWLEYTANIVPAAYDIGVNVSSTVEGQIRVLAANSNSAGFLRELGTINVSDTGGTFSTEWLEGVNLTTLAGPESVIRLEFVGGGFEVDSIEFESPEQSLFVEERTITTARTETIQLEEFDLGGQGVAYFDTSPGNETDSGYRMDEDVEATSTLITNQVFDGEWLEYTTDIVSGIYDINLGVAWTAGEAGVKLFVGDSNSTTEFAMLGEFAFGVEEEVLTLEDVDLSSWAGANRVIRAEIVGNWMGLDYLDFVPQSTGLACDVVGFGNGCDIDDVDAIVAEIAAGTNATAFDLTGDGLVNLADRDAWLTTAGAANLSSGNPYLPGDSNLDGVVDISDFNIWNANKFNSIAEWSSADFNADGVVDISDFNIWNAKKFRASDSAQRSGGDANRVRDLVFSDPFDADEEEVSLKI